jgi:iron complex transport system ATP-binding protein
MSVHIEANNLSIGYGDVTIVPDLFLSIPKGKVTTLIGPNGCGKSTVLKTISRLMKQSKGLVYLEGKEIHKESTKKLAQKMAILPQTPEAPAGLTVYELVSYGRFPYKKGIGGLTKEDSKIVRRAIEETGMTAYATRPIEALSGGQRQRAWIAMALAQETDLLLLDEPTTYLDLAHQLEILQLLEKLNKKSERTIVMVLHDLNHASRFSDYMVAMKDGCVVHKGTPAQVMTREILKHTFSIDAEIVKEPRSGKPICFTYELVDEMSDSYEIHA